MIKHLKPKEEKLRLSKKIRFIYLKILSICFKLLDFSNKLLRSVLLFGFSLKRVLFICSTLFSNSSMVVELVSSELISRSSFIRVCSISLSILYRSIFESKFNIFILHSRTVFLLIRMEIFVNFRCQTPSDPWCFGKFIYGGFADVVDGVEMSQELFLTIEA